MDYYNLKAISTLVARQMHSHAALIERMKSKCSFSHNNSNVHVHIQHKDIYDKI